jgi:type II secretory pathway component PulF
MSEAGRDAKSVGPIGLDQLLALNEEIAALVRAGLPLGRGLLEVGRDVRGRLGRIAGMLGKRLNRGEDLAEALEAEKGSIPPMYRAVVEAGARAGRLPAALEGMAGYIRAVADARRSIGLALWYPGLVLCVAYLLFAGLVFLVLPKFIEALVGLRLPIPAPLRWMETAWETGIYWLPAGPIVLVLVMVVWFRSGTTAGVRGRTWSGLRLFPWMGSLLADYEAAGFAELLALLLDHRVPYPEALVLAAEAAGAPRLIGGARRVAEAIERGEPAAAAVEAAGTGTFPPMLRWTLATGQVQGSLGSALHHLADLYRKRARYRAEQLALFLPMIVTLVVGVGVVACYALSLFVPLAELVNGLSNVPN